MEQPRKSERGSGHIVVGMDFSALAIAAARWTARHIADGDELVLAHAICIPEPPAFLKGLHPPIEPLVEDARRGAEVRLREVISALGGGRVWPEIRVGRPDEVLKEVTSQYRAGLVVVGPHGDRPGIGKLLGGTAERMAREAPASVLLARALREDGPQTVLVALEESPVNAHVLDWVKRLQRKSGAAVVALHVVNPLIGGAVLRGAGSSERRRAEEQLRQRAEEWLQQELASHELEGATTEVAFGDAGFEILSAAERVGADVVVLGRSAPGRGRSTGIGGTAAFIMRNGTGSVLLVAPPAA